MQALSVIIPVRESKNHDICARLRLKSQCVRGENIEFVVIDDGSTWLASEKIKQTCNELGFTYHRLDTENRVWNAARARNFGIKIAAYPTLFFEDVDIINSDGFYEKAFDLYQQSQLSFVVFPVIYLKSGVSHLDFFEKKLEENRDKIAYFAHSSSSLICAKSLALDVGGYNEGFEGWGYEDYDFWIRLLLASPLEKPKDFFTTHTHRFEIAKYEGWKAMFRFHAMPALMSELYSYHPYHPQNKIKNRNKSLFESNIEKYKSIKSVETISLKDNEYYKNLFNDKYIYQNNQNGNKLQKLIYNPKQYFKDAILKWL